MADTLEYSEVAFPRARFDDALIAEIEKFAPSQLEITDRDGDGNWRSSSSTCTLSGA